MPRPKKASIPEVASNGKAHRVGPNPLDLAARIASVRQREAENARRSSAMQKVVVNMPLHRKEAFLELAERHNEVLSVVARACMEYGYAYFSRFVAVDPNAPSPFLAGSIGHGGPHPGSSHRYGEPPPRIVDPVGAMWPPAPVPQVWSTPVVPDDRPIDRHSTSRPVPRETFVTVTEDDFAPKGQVRMNGKNVPVEGILPSSGSFPTPEKAPVRDDVQPPEPEPEIELPRAQTHVVDGNDAPVFAFGATEEPVAAE